MVSNSKPATVLGLLTVIFNLPKLEIIFSHVLYRCILMVGRLPFEVV